MFARTIDRFRPHCSARNGVRGCFLALVIVGIQPVFAQDGWAISHGPRFSPARKSSLEIDKPGSVGEQTPALPNLQDVTTLEPGKSAERELSGEQSHAYQITLTEGECANLIVEQRGIDVVVQLIAADGTSIADFDNEWRTHGEEKIEVVAEAAGNYHLFVKAKYPRLPAGLYEIRLIKQDAATEKERLLYEAHKLSTESSKLLQAGKYEEARSLATRALELGEKALGPDHSYVAYLLCDLGFIQRQKGEYAKAEALLQRALAINEKELGLEHPQTAEAMSILGLVYRSTNDHAKAERLLQQALEITERTLGAEHPRALSTLINLDALHFDMGDFAQEERDLKRALTIAEKTLDPDNPLIVRVLHNLGDLYRVKKDYEKAEPFVQRALAIEERKLGPDHPETAETLQLLGVIARERKDYVRALELSRRALAIREHALGPEHPKTADLLNSIANIYRAQGDYTEALEIYQRVLNNTEKSVGPYNGFKITALGNIARTYAAQGDIAKAITAQTSVEASIETALALDLAIGSERQKLAYLDSLAERTDRTISLHVRLAPNDQAACALAALVLLQRKGRVLDAMSESFVALRKRSDTEDQKSIDQLNSTTAQLAKLALNSPQKMGVDEYQKQIKSLEKQKEKFEAEISQRSAEFRAQSQPVTLAAVQAAIPPDAALIEFAIYRPFDPKAASNNDAYGTPHYVAYVVRRHGGLQWKELGEAKEIDSAIAALRQALGDPQRKDVQRLARAVDEKVMRPVRALTGDTRQLLISPDGELNLIPFAALVDEQGDYLLKRYAFNYVTSGRDLLRLQVQRESKSPPVVIADPAFGEPAVIAANGDPGHGAAGERAQLDYSQIFFGPLPGVGDEVRSLKQLLPQATFLTKEQATKAALKRVSGPSILHIATHGFFLENDPPQGKQPTAQPKDQTRLGKWVAHVENPLLRSGLALAGANQAGIGNDNGVLTAFEASGLDLWGTKLVVLSACDTGIGEVKNGDGVYGLRRALVLAGSESQMMSLWAVSDRSTRDLIVGYYTALLGGAGRGEALRQVQLEMLHSKSRNHPYYWAGFILSGQWRKL